MKHFQIFLSAIIVLLAACNREVELPTVITGDNDIINETHFVACDGRVTDDGGSTVFERGICYISGSDVPTIEGLHKSGGSGRGSFTCQLGTLAEGTYNYRAYAINEAGVAYGDTKSFSVYSPWVDLDLPSGLLWAKCNLGASKPEEYGKYYAWGETITKEEYSFDTYVYYNNGRLTKYCNIASYGYNGYTDNLTTLQPEDDVATVTLGSDARMPTRANWQELINNCTRTWTTQNGVKGYLFTGSNGNTLFLPAAGCRHDTQFNNVGTGGYYWSSLLYTGNPQAAEGVCFDYSGIIISGDNYGFSREIGFSVRAVHQK